MQHRMISFTCFIAISFITTALAAAPNGCTNTDDFCAYIKGIPANEGRYIQTTSGGQPIVNCLSQGDPIIEIQYRDLSMTGPLTWPVAICNDQNGTKCTALAPIRTYGFFSPNNNIQNYAKPKFVEVDVSHVMGHYPDCKASNGSAPGLNNELPPQ